MVKKKIDNLMSRSFNKKDWFINILFTILRNLFGGERFFNLSKIISYEIIEI
jgi:hypothetical protein